MMKNVDRVHTHTSNLKTKKGITLIALIVTIIVLLILAGVAVATLTGENGLLNRAKFAKESYQKAQDDEKEIMDQLANQMVSGNRDEITMSRDDLISLIKEYSNPVGTVIAQMGNSEPDGYVKCDGSWYSISGEYKALADYIFEQFGTYDYFKLTGEESQEGKFKVPDLQGEFLRGTGTNSHTNQGNGTTVGTHQDGTRINNIDMTDNSTRIGIGARTSNYYSTNADKTFTEPDKYYQVPIGPGTTAGGYSYENTESWVKNTIVSVIPRSTNTSVLYCIKYK